MWWTQQAPKKLYSRNCAKYTAQTGIISECLLSRAPWFCHSACVMLEIWIQGLGLARQVFFPSATSIAWDCFFTFMEPSPGWPWTFYVDVGNWTLDPPVFSSQVCESPNPTGDTLVRNMYLMKNYGYKNPDKACGDSSDRKMLAKSLWEPKIHAHLKMPSTVFVPASSHCCDKMLWWEQFWG